MISNINMFAYRKNLMELWDKNFKTFILKDNNFTAQVVYYKLEVTKKYILKKYFIETDNKYNLRNDLKEL